jgi:antitoxin ParD1/3/4
MKARLCGNALGGITTASLLAIIANHVMISAGGSMPTRNINLTDHFDRFVERQVATGRYGNASEIIREALRLLEEQEQIRNAKLKALRQAAKVGFDQIDNGEGIRLQDKKAVGKFMAEIAAEVKATKRSRSDDQ